MERIILTSRITVLYKLILPIFWIVVTLMLWVAAIALFNEPDGDALAIIALFFTGFFALFMLPPMFVCKVSYDDNNMYAYNYRREKVIPLSKVNKVNRWMFYFFRIGYQDANGKQKSVLMLPSFVQRFEAMMGTPENLEEFEAKIGG